jgi:type I restriction enzyme S subunit
MEIECFPDAPSGWERMPLGRVVKVNPRYPVEKRKEYPFLPMERVSEGFGGIRGFEKREYAGGLSRYRDRDVLFAKITPCAENGKVALVEHLDGDVGLGSTEFIVLSPRDGFDPRYVFALLTAAPVWRRAVSRMEGSTGRQRVTEDTFSKWLVVAVPDRDEQMAIADQLEHAEDAICGARRHLEALERVRVGILQHFFAVAEGNLARVGDYVSDIRYGTSIASNDRGWGWPTLRIPNVIGGQLDVSDLTYVETTAADAQRKALQLGDLLMVRTNGNPHYIGRSAVFHLKDSRTFLFASYLLRVRFRDGMSCEFVDEYLKSGVGRRELFRRATTSAGNYNINSNSVRAVPMPAFGPDEQEDVRRSLAPVKSALRTAHARLDQLLRLKRTLLNDLLAGRVRAGETPQLVGAPHEH